MCRAGTGPDGHPIHADNAFTGLATASRMTGSGETDGAELRRRQAQDHASDVDPRGVINAGIADKAKKYAKPIADREISGCMALVLNAGCGMSKDFSDLIYRLARKRTERVLGPAPASATTTRTRNPARAQFTRQARREGCKAPSRRSGPAVNLTCEPRGRSQGCEGPANTSLRSA